MQLAPFYVAVIFGALLGRVTIETGIARTIVDFAAEYGGEQPLVLSLGFCAIVAVLFTSLSGLGGIIMVGSIVLPIMMTAGVPRTIAATLFLMGFALGFIFNIANWTFYTHVFRGFARAADTLCDRAGAYRRDRVAALRRDLVPARARLRDLGGSRRGG